MYLPDFEITSPYGNRPQYNDFHAGVDFGVPIGTPLPALVDGVIQFSGSIPPAKPGYSWEKICVLQADGFFIVYGHLSDFVAQTGQRVKAGQIIAKSGNSGFADGPHLHIEKRLGTKNPGNPLSAYQSVDITPLLRAYGQAQGGAQDVTVFIRPIQPLKATFKKPIMMFNIETNEPKWESGSDALFVGKTNIVHGSTFYVTQDRWDSGEPFGFKEQDIYAKGNKVDEVPNPPANDEAAKKLEAIKKILE